MKQEAIRINVDPTNPGQFFACCGLLELADRLWGEAHGCFARSAAEFRLTCIAHPGGPDEKEFIRELGDCRISSTMKEDEILRLKKLLNQKKTTLMAEDSAEKQRLTELWNRERIRFHEPFCVWIDWWSDERSGGSRFKTWAGKQFVLDLVRGMQAPLRTDSWMTLPPEKWLGEPTDDGSLPLYFDADTGGQSSSIDVGFSLDSLDMRSRTKPMIELAAFVGLQRFRPSSDRTNDSFSYTAWTQPLPPLLAAVACSGQLSQPNARTFEFRLLYRTKYLKSFLPAKPKGE